MEMIANRKVLVVGATGGIGQEAIKLLKGSQANLFLTGRDKKKLKEVADANEVPDDQIFELDITDGDAVQKVADKIHDKVDKIDILVNVAGIGIIKSLDELTAQEFSKTIDVNLKGAFHLFKSFIPPMKEAKKGLVI